MVGLRAPNFKNFFLTNADEPLYWAGPA